MLSRACENEESKKNMEIRKTGEKKKASVFNAIVYLRDLNKTGVSCCCVPVLCCET